MKKFLTVGIFAALLFGSASAHAEMTGEELLSLYDTGDEEMRDLLESIIDGNANGISWLNSYLDEFKGPDHMVYCPPDDLALDGPKMIDMMRTTTENDPRYAALPYGATVLFTYIDFFPCD